MPLPVKKLEWRDIDQHLPSVQKLETFKAIAEYAIAQGARIFDMPSGSKGWMGFLENFYWRAEDLYILRESKNPVKPGDVYHPTLHYLFVRKYGIKLDGNPLSMLLAESIASMSEYGLVLETLSKFGFGGFHEAKFIASMIEMEKTSRGLSQADAEVNVVRFLQTEVGNPFLSFRHATEELFEYFRYMFKAGVRRTKDEHLDFSKYIEHCKKLRYGSVILRFYVGLNVADAMAFGGRESTAEDQEIIRDCLSAIRTSNSMLEFLGKMGMDTAATGAKSAA